MYRRPLPDLPPPFRAPPGFINAGSFARRFSCQSLDTKVYFPVMLFFGHVGHGPSTCRPRANQSHGPRRAVGPLIFVTPSHVPTDPGTDIASALWHRPCVEIRTHGYALCRRWGLGALAAASLSPLAVRHCSPNSQLFGSGAVLRGEIESSKAWSSLASGLWHRTVSCAPGFASRFTRRSSGRPSLSSSGVCREKARHGSPCASS